ncbi:MAG TPA: AlpA family phage regulatory protein [Solimonas sp.]|nr:AlpA family phage regulatory protein [Solimonas sp.]
MNDMDWRFVRRPEVCRLSGLKASTIYARVANGTFPKPHNLGARAVAWHSAELQAWMSNPSAWVARHQMAAAA